MRFQIKGKDISLYFLKTLQKSVKNLGKLKSVFNKL